jgi:hypothetical protein
MMDNIDISGFEPRQDVQLKRWTSIAASEKRPAGMRMLRDTPVFKNIARLFRKDQEKTRRPISSSRPVEINVCSVKGVEEVFRHRPSLVEVSGH